MARRHITSHKGIREYEGDETGNIVLGQGGVDVLRNTNDEVTAGEDGTNSKVNNNAVDLTNVKQWVSITALGDSTATDVPFTLQVKNGSEPYTDITIELPVGATIYGAFYHIDGPTTTANGRMLWCVRG
jgi:hypothetical protein